MEEKLIYRDNQALLLSLGLGEPATKPAKSAEALKKLHIAAQKRKLKDEKAHQPDTDIAEGRKEDTPQQKRPRPSLASTVASSSGDGSSSRRSSRSIQPIKRLADEVFAEGPEDEFIDDEGIKRKRRGEEPLRRAKSLGQRTQNPYVTMFTKPGLFSRKQFGHIPGVEVGRTWATRMECSTDAIHA